MFLEMEEMMLNLILKEEIKTEDKCFISVSIYISYFIYLQSFWGVSILPKSLLWVLFNQAER